MPLIFLPKIHANHHAIIFLYIRGSVRTQTATLNVKLTFVGVWLKMPDVKVVAEMSKPKLIFKIQCVITKFKHKIKKT